MHLSQCKTFLQHKKNAVPTVTYNTSDLAGIESQTQRLKAKHGQPALVQFPNSCQKATDPKKRELTEVIKNSFIIILVKDYRQIFM